MVLRTGRPHEHQSLLRCGGGRIHDDPVGHPHTASIAATDVHPSSGEGIVLMMLPRQRDAPFPPPPPFSANDVTARPHWSQTPEAFPMDQSGEYRLW